MQTSIVIVSKNRKSELDKTISILENLIDYSTTEILVFLDGCTDDSFLLKKKYKNVNWYFSQKTIGASAARKELYSHAKGEILIGFDDDAHPLNSNFIEITKSFFEENNNLAVVAFEEIRGVFSSDFEALVNSKKQQEDHFTSEFVGCGFAIRKEHYQNTNGFPEWIDIYGEEACVSIELLDKGYDILKTQKIKVNHRVDNQTRILAGKNYFRFRKQLKNETFFYLVYYPNPIKKIVKLYWHNLKKYGIKDWNYFKIYILTIFKVLFSMPKIVKYRNPVKKTTILKRESL